jgi:Rrf2 family protein
VDIFIHISYYGVGMFSQTAEYALRAAVFLAMRSPNAQTAQQIAAECRVPTDYLFKALQPLSRAGLLSAQRGKHGGFSLTRDPSEISILDIIQAVDPIKRIRQCPLGLKEHGVRLCPVHRKLDDALCTIEDTFRDSMLSDLIDPTADIVPLCPKPELIPETALHAKPY